MDIDVEPAAPVKARATAIAVCVPLALLALWLVAIPANHPWRAATIDLMQSYAALLIAFCAGARFGMTRMGAEHDTGRTLLLTTIPVLAGWVALRFDQPWSFAILALAAAAQGAWDNFAAHRGDLPLWFGRYRVSITFAAVLAMIVGFLVTAS